jgi:hypothetical protein
MELAKTHLLTADQVRELLSTCVSERSSCFLRQGKIHTSGEILDANGTLFELRNPLDRQTVLEELKGKSLALRVPLHGFLFEGTTSLLGLGFIKPFPTLKLALPTQLKKVEKRHHYRLSHFLENSKVTYSTTSYLIGQGALLDISMSGCGIRADMRTQLDMDKLRQDPRMFLDIEVGQGVAFRVEAAVVYVGKGKLGCHFHRLPEQARSQLHGFIVESRRKLLFERSKEKDRSEVAMAPPPAEEDPRPSCLVVGDDPGLLELLQSILHRKFRVISCSFKVQAVREALQRRQVLTLLELRPDDPEQVRLARKLGQIVLSESPLLYFGENLHAEFCRWFQGHGPCEEILLELSSRKKLEVFKRIEGYLAKHMRIS